MTRTLHVAIAQFKPKKGPHTANLKRLAALFAQVDGLSPRPDVLQFGETALTGYFVEGGVREVARSAGDLAQDLNEAWVGAVQAPRSLDVVVGFYERWNGTLYNSALYATLGATDPGAPGARVAVVRHVHRKNFLPTYGLFDEERFVERGYEVRAFTAPWGRTAVLVCEDAWHSLTGALAALDGAEVVFVCAAAPARGIHPREDGVSGPANVPRWERLARDIAEEHGVYVSLANLVGSEGGKAFFGHSLVCGPHGDIRIRGPLWDEAIVMAPLDLGDLARARADLPLLTDLRTALPHLRTSLDAIEAGTTSVNTWDGPSNAEAVTARPTTQGTKGGDAVARTAKAGTDGHDGGSAALRVVRPEPGCGAGPPPLEIDAPVVEEWLTRFIRDETERRGFNKVVVGLSGGVDSAVAATLAARALGTGGVLGVRLPYRTSSRDSLEHGQLVIDRLGIESRTLDISPAVDGYLAGEPDASPARRGNVMARLRMIALFDLSAKHHAIPLGTGNKTERLFGYFTWHADDSPPINPLGDLFKTQIWALARHLQVPEAIIAKATSGSAIPGRTRS
jgi:NAD+ synthase (glutamine-hydrolysing)